MNGQETIESYLYLLIEAVNEDNSGFYISCLSQNQAIDEARNSIFERLKTQIEKCYIAEIGVVNSDEIDMSKYEKESQNNILLSSNKFPFESREDYNFIAPNGIVKSAHSPKDFEDLELSYSKIEDNYASYTLEIVPDLFTISEVIKIITENSLKEMNFLGIYIDELYDNQDIGESAIWVKIDSKNNLFEFIAETKNEILDNGFLVIEFGNKDSNNRIRIRKTKEIVFWTESEIDILKIQSELNSIGFKESENNVSIGNDFEHFKYRMSNSLNREELINYLLENNFEKHKL
jgi:hypothetical protein